MVISIVIGTSTLSAWKSASVNWTVRWAPRQRSIALRTVDYPLSPGPIRQLMPLDRTQVSSVMLRAVCDFSYTDPRHTTPPRKIWDNLGQPESIGVHHVAVYIFVIIDIFCSLRCIAEQNMLPKLTTRVRFPSPAPTPVRTCKNRSNPWAGGEAVDLSG